MEQKLVSYGKGASRERSWFSVYGACKKGHTMFSFPYFTVADADSSVTQTQALTEKKPVAVEAHSIYPFA